VKGGGSPSGLHAGHSVDPRTRSGPGALFDVHIIVDWSARATPSPAKPTKDAIWWAVARHGQVAEPQYARTRVEALQRLEAEIAAVVQAGERVLVGFDFPFGYPAGVAARLTGKPDALALWDWLDARLQDGADNANNRFAVASEINCAFDGIGPMWGRPEAWDYPDIPTRGTARRGDHPPERRLVEQAVPRAMTVWQLAYAGSVGSQILVGLPAVKRLRARFGDVSAIWPFETGLQAPKAQVVFAEIYPSLLAERVKAEQRDGEILDAAQVRVNAAAYHALDRKGGLAPLFEASPELSAAERDLVAKEEAWILGVGHEAALRTAGRGPRPQPLRYERDPAAIYRQSFAIVQKEARLERFGADLQPLVTRLIHACGMVEIADRLAFSQDVAASASKAIAAGAPILCDCEMVRSGIIARLLPQGTEVIATLNAPCVLARAAEIENTRSAAAVELWEDHIEGRAKRRVGNGLCGC